MPDEPLVDTAPEARTDAAPVDAPADAAASVADPYDSGDVTFDRPYVERLRSESAARHAQVKELDEKFAPWKDALDGWEPDQADAVRQLLTAAKAGDTDTVMAILGLEAPGAETAVASPAEQAAAAGVTLADVERMLNEREQKAERDRQIQAIEAEAEALGYSKGSPDYAVLFKLAHEQTNGDLKAADAKVKEWKQSLVDNFVSEKANGATPPPQQGGPASGERQILTLEDAKAAALTRFGATPVAQ